MGIVIKQSIKNLVFTYLGFVIGALNTLFLYPYLLEEEYYGLINVLLSTAMIFYPLMSFGMGNAIIRFYSTKKSQEEKNRFISFTFLFPLLLIAPAAIFFEFFQDIINGWLSDNSKLLKNYTSYIYVLAIFIGYFEVFFAFSKVQLKSVFGNILKEIFIRVVVTILLVLLYLKVIDDHMFIVLITAAYGIRTLIMAFYSIRISKFKLSISYYEEWKPVVVYSFFIIVSSSVTYILIELDKLMVSQFIDLSNVAYYAVGGFIGIVVAVPGRAMQQILAPLTSKALSENNIDEVEKLYKKSSINLLLISGLMFLLISLNIHAIFYILPEKFAVGEVVAQLIALSKLIDMIGGINGTIISNSKVYKIDLLFGVLLIAFAIGSNMVLIPKYGLSGAAMATVLSTLFFNVLKLAFIKYYFKIQPFSVSTLYSLVFLFVTYYFIYSLNIDYNPLITIIVNSLIVTLLFVLFLVIVKPSQDIEELIKKILKR
ncbi:MAG: oligosaccharide flippase family protein [Flavobacteriales bacterium]|nr:oligosaccharide flippase family protein [Flavobacteriales bacterium]